MVAAIHPLTPGSPAYAILKMSAVGGLIALRMVMARRSKAKTEESDESPEPAPEPPERLAHPVSRRKAQRRRRRR